MAKFLGKYDIRSWDYLTGSADLSDRRRIINSKQRIPFRLQRGNQSRGFKKSDIQPSQGITDPVIIKLDDTFSYIRMTKADYQAKLERNLLTEISGANARRGSDMSTSVYNSLRAQVITKLADLPNIIMILSEDTPFTGSYTITSGSNFYYSGIANENGYLDRTINNQSPTATGASWSFANTSSVYGDGVSGNEFHQAEYTSSFIVRTYSSGSNSGSYIGQVSALQTASRVDSGQTLHYFYTGSGGILASSARYNRTILNANVFGDGNETTFAAQFAEPTSAMYAASREIITFPYDTVVASGSFDFAHNFTHLVLPGFRQGTSLGFRPAKVVTLYWASGSGGLLGSNGLSGSISPSTMIPDNTSEATGFDVTGMASGSHLFLNKELTMPASGGYYSTMFIGQTNSVSTGYTVHVAGDGILGNSTTGSKYFANPFNSAHESTASLITAAPRWNGLSFTSS